jgi:O-antigen/teichoic acid export membrane protein
VFVVIFTGHAAYPRLVVMTVAFATSNVARAAVGFATAVVIGRGLGVEGFGRWTLCMAWAGLLTTLFDVGFGVVLTRDAARADPGIARTVGAAFCVRLGLLLPVAVAFSAATSWLTADAQLVDALRLAPGIAAAGVAYGCLAAVFRAWPRHLVTVLTIEAVSALAQCAAAWWLIHAGRGVSSLLVLAAGAQLAQCAAVMILWRMTIGRRHHFEWPSWFETKAIVRSALPFAWAGLIANAQLRIAPLLLGYLSTASALALFGAASRIGNLVRMVPHAAFAGALPVFAHEVQRGDADPVRSRFDDLLRRFSIGAGAGIALLAGPIIHATYGRDFAAAATPLIWIAIGLLPSLVNSGRKVYLYASGREKVAVRWSAVALAIQTAGCVALIPAFGAAGAAAALAVGEAIVWWPLRTASVASGVSRGFSRTGDGPAEGADYARITSA